MTPRLRVHRDPCFGVAPANGAGEIAAQPFGVALLAFGDGVHEQIAADEGALPQFADAAEDFFVVAAAAGLVDAHLERAQHGPSVAAKFAPSTLLVVHVSPLRWADVHSWPRYERERAEEDAFAAAAGPRVEAAV
jgi:hypothetical protein